MKSWIGANWGWIVVVIITLLPLIYFNSYVELNVEDPGYDLFLFEDYESKDGKEFISGAKYLLKCTGEIAIWFFLVLFWLTPFRNLFGFFTQLTTRQALGIACGFYSFLHVFLYIYSNNFLAAFSEFELIAGSAAAILILILALTSNRLSMRILGVNWKRIHRLVYLVSLLILIHVIGSSDSYLIYTVLLGVALLLRWNVFIRLLMTRDQLKF